MYRVYIINQLIPFSTSNAEDHYAVVTQRWENGKKTQISNKESTSKAKVAGQKKG